MYMHLLKSAALTILQKLDAQLLGQRHGVAVTASVPFVTAATICLEGVETQVESKPQLQHQEHISCGLCKLLSSHNASTCIIIQAADCHASSKGAGDGSVCLYYFGPNIQQSGEVLYVKLLHFGFCSQPNSNGRVYLCDLGTTYHRVLDVKLLHFHLAVDSCVSTNTADRQATN